MPIPQLKNNNQSWRNNNEKKYFIKKDSSFYQKPKGNGNKKSFWQKIKKKFFVIISLFSIICAVFLIAIFIWLSKNLPNPNQLQEREIAQSTKIYDRTGENILYEIHGEEERTLITIDEIPDHVEWAVISMEDKDFYNHKGFSLWAIARSTFKMVFSSGRGSGSTLTQQFVKNAILTNERSIIRKLKELILSYKIEKKYSKKEILQMYLNEIPYGSTAYGIESASKKYFGKSVREINIAEAAILAALIQAPSKYSPYGSNKDLLIGRQQYIIGLMEEQGHISKEEAEVAKKYELKFKTPGTNIKAPHFVMYVKEILSEKYGEKTIEQGGLKIYTTLDLNKQKIAEEVINEQSEKNIKNFNANNAALLSIDPKNGQILTMVGSRDYFNDEIDGQVNIITSKRQPGSSIKPLVYATAFSKGFNPNTILFDVNTNFSNDPVNPYTPKNYDNNERGPISMRKALAGSLNIPAVKTLYLAGINNVLSIAQDLGYTTFKDKDRFGLSFVLGGGEVKIIEHINAFSAFAREGEIHPISAILKIEDKNGEILEEFKDDVKKVLDPKLARQINSVLSDNNARSYVFGTSNWLNLGDRPVAAKTGTTNDYRDAWTIGYTPSIVTGVWVGNNNNSEMKKGADGSAVAAPIWRNYMKKILDNTPIETFKDISIEKTGIKMIDGENAMDITIKIDKNSGLRATENTPPEFIEEKVFQEPHCILYFIDKNNPLGGYNKNPENDPQFKLWESAVQDWFKKQDTATNTPPIEFDDLHTTENIPAIIIKSPQNHETISNSLLTIEPEITAKRTIASVEYYINNNLFFSTQNSPYNFSQKINFLKNGFHKFKIKACDDVKNCSEKEIELNLSLTDTNIVNDLKFSIFSPENNSTFKNSEIPIPIKLSLNSPQMFSKINCYKNNEFFTQIQPVSNIIETTELTIVDIGNYEIYCEAVKWDNEKIKTELININIE